MPPFVVTEDKMKRKTGRTLYSRPASSNSVSLGGYCRVMVWCSMAGMLKWAARRHPRLRRKGDAPFIVMLKTYKRGLV